MGNLVIRTPAQIRKAANGFVIHWMNGNWRYVLDEIMEEEPDVLAYLIALIMLHLPPPDRPSFVEALGTRI